jgi:hypothetical protein
MNVVFRHAWMQKHPTPTNRGGDFHWHPAGIPAAIRNTLSDLVTRTRGQESSLWIINEGHVAWARAFSAISPSDRRRYTGLAVTLAEMDAGAGAPGLGHLLPEVLARLPLTAAVPFAGEQAVHSARLEGSASATPGATRPLAVDPRTLLSLFDECDRDLAAAVYLGGQVFSREPQAERLPALMGRLLSWIPPDERARPRTGVFASSRTGMDARTLAGPVENFVHYLTAAWFCPRAIVERWPGFAVDTWGLVFDLATSSGCSLPELFADLTRVAEAWDTAENLRQHLLRSGVLSAEDLAECDRRAPGPLCADTVADAGWLWNRLLHYWGRGFLPEAMLPRLAGLLARRVVVDHLFHLDAPERAFLPRRYVRRLRYEALLSRQRVTAMTSAVAAYVPSLSPTREVQLG